MNNITQAFLDELFATQKKLTDMYDELRTRIYQINNWETENIGRPLSREDRIRGRITDVNIKSDEVEIESFGFDDIAERDKEFYYYLPLSKLLNDDWKEPALAKYKAEQEKKQKEKELEEAKTARELEEREHAEYERLKAKFER